MLPMSFQADRNLHSAGGTKVSDCKGVLGKWVRAQRNEQHRWAGTRGEWGQDRVAAFKKEAHLRAIVVCDKRQT